MFTVHRLAEKIGYIVIDIASLENLDDYDNGRPEVDLVRQVRDVLLQYFVPDFSWNEDTIPEAVKEDLVFAFEELGIGNVFIRIRALGCDIAVQAYTQDDGEQVVHVCMI